MKKSIFLCLISLFYLNFSALCIKTELLIRAQDDETVGGLKLRISIPKDIQDGPAGENIEVITNNRKDFAIKDNDDNFILYSVDAKTNTLIPSINNRSYPHRFPGDSEQIIVSGRRKDIKHIGVDQTAFFDSVSTFGTIWSVLNMYENDLPGLALKRGKIRVYPHMTPSLFSELYPELKYDDFKNNAFYDNRRGHVLCFFPVSSENSKYTSQYFDIVAHETGHYVLNVLRPDLWQSPSSDRKAFHESFGDVTALFSVLSFSELRQKVLEKTEGNLHKSSFLSIIGEKIVDRDASQCTDLSVLPSCEQHDLSERLTRAIYGTLADFFNVERGRHAINPLSLDLLLKNTTDTVRKSFLRATRSSELASFIDFGRSLREEGRLPWDLVHSNFLRQQIDLTNPLSLPQICLKEDKDQSTLLGCSTGRLQKTLPLIKDLGSSLGSLRLESSERKPYGLPRSPGSGSSSSYFRNY
ncbi:MAG: hypothetical protein K2W92_09545 [Alphaproteobacteria bacterium]|nr:hypothetical protein [Alphaproteobacteria bacterium]